MPSVPLYLSNGKHAPFRPSKYDVAILATNDAGLLAELDSMRERGIGGLIEISESEYLALRDGTKPELNKVNPNFKRLNEIAHGRLKFKPIDSGIRTVGKFIHVVERHQQRDLDSERRVNNAVASWAYHYAKGLQACHVWEGFYQRSADQELGDPRHLPFLKDLLSTGLSMADRPGDIILLTNDDTVLHHQVVMAMTRLLQDADALSSFRMNFKRQNMPALDTPVGKIRQWGEACSGRDLFAFRAEWLRRNWESIPDFCLGVAEWDLALAILVRIAAKVEITKENFAIHDPTCELERGYITHEIHNRNWMLKEFTEAPATVHNNRLFAEFAADNGLEELIGRIL